MILAVWSTLMSFWDFKTILLTLLAISLLVYKWATKHYGFFSSQNIPHVKPTFLFGSLGPAVMRKKNAVDIHRKLYHKFEDRKFYGMYEFRKPILVIRDLDLMRQVAIKDFDHFVDHRNFASENMDPLFDNILILMKGDKWRNMRSILSPAFTGSKMRLMFDLISVCGDDVMGYIKDEIAANGAPKAYEMKSMITKFAIDVIGTTAFGIKVDSFRNPDNEFYKVGSSLTTQSFMQQLRMTLLMLSPKLMKLFGMEVFQKEHTQFVRSLVLDTIAHREREGIVRPDMLNLLREARKGKLMHATIDDKKLSHGEGFATVEESNVGKQSINHNWTDDEIVAQCFIFFIAGFETISNLLLFIAYELAINPGIQSKLIAEIDETSRQLAGKRLNYETLQQMKYMDMVVSEGLRKWPPSPFTDRKCTLDYAIADKDIRVTVRKGEAILFPTYAIHRDPKYFPQPETFDPERFSDSRKGEIVPGSFIPFGIGPRNCIGSRFALMEAKAYLFYLLTNFNLDVCDQTPIPLVLVKNAVSMMPEKKIWLKFRPRADGRAQ